MLLAARGHDAARVLECYAEDAVAVSPVFGEVRGRAEVAATWSTLFTTFADLTMENIDFLVDGDRVAVLGQIKTTDRIGWFGLPPTGSPIAYRLVMLFTVRDGVIVRDERIYDSAGLMERLEKARVDKEPAPRPRCSASCRRAAPASARFTNRSATRCRAAPSAATSSRPSSCRRAAAPS
jgi:ketosteroid isomerase-like protein